MKKKIAVIFILLLAVAGVYAGGREYFKDHVLPNTYLGEEDVSYMEIASLKDFIKKRNIKITAKDGVVEFPLEEGGLVEKASHLTEYRQDADLWPLAFFKTRPIEEKIERSADRDKLISRLKQEKIFTDMTPPENAEILRNDDGFTVKEETEGNTVNLEAVADSVIEAFEDGRYDVQLDSEYEKPEVRAEDLTEEARRLNETANREVTFHLPDGGEETLKGIDFMNEENELDPLLVQDYVMGVKGKYDNVGAPRSFTTSGGANITVSGGIYGIQLNRDSTTENIMAAFNDPENPDAKPAYTRYAENGGKIGNTYIEISIASQHMWLYKNGELVVDTPVVTGNVSEGYGTPGGVWEVWVKERDRRLRGDNGDGTRYDVPVSFWMQVDYTGIGIHDTYYRSAYGGEIYRNNGSHGCINTPYNALKTIYNNTEYGTPVVIY